MNAVSSFCECVGCVAIIECSLAIVFVPLTFRFWWRLWFLCWIDANPPEAEQTSPANIRCCVHDYLFLRPCGRQHPRGVYPVDFGVATLCCIYLRWPQLCDSGGTKIRIQGQGMHVQSHLSPFLSTWLNCDTVVDS